MIGKLVDECGRCILREIGKLIVEMRSLLTV